MADNVPQATCPRCARKMHWSALARAWACLCGWTSADHLAR